MTVTAVLSAAITKLAEAGVASPRVDAELLLAHVLDRPRGRLLTAPDPAPELVARFAELVARRAAREPLQHLTGTAPFRYLDLAVGPGVFVPRPETELLVEHALPFLQALAEPIVVDLCAGSGAVALAVATEVPGARVTAVELSEQALVYLRRNASPTSGAGDAVTVVAGDVFDRDLLAEFDGTVDAVLANPPYVPDTAPIAPEVAADPPGAVFAGPDGLDVLPAIVAAAARLLRPGGLLVVEHDESHAAQVEDLLAAGDWTEVRGHDDLTGRARHVSARRAGPAHPQGTIGA